jgi:hypothetical protein
MHLPTVFWQPIAMSLCIRHMKCCCLAGSSHPAKFSGGAWTINPPAMIPSDDKHNIKYFNNGSCTSCRAIWSEIKCVITKSNGREAGVRFVITS